MNFRNFIRYIYIYIYVYVYVCNFDQVDRRNLFRNLAIFLSLHVPGLLGASNIFVTFLERHIRNLYALYPNISTLDERTRLNNSIYKNNKSSILEQRNILHLTGNTAKLRGYNTLAVNATFACRKAVTIDASSNLRYSL